MSAIVAALGLTEAKSAGRTGGRLSRGGRGRLPMPSDVVDQMPSESRPSDGVPRRTE